MEKSMNKIKIVTVVIILAGFSYLLIDNKPNEVPIENSLTISDDQQNFNTQNISAATKSSESLEVQQITQSNKENYSDSKKVINMPSKELTKTDSPKDEEKKMSGVQLHKYIISKFENEEIDYIWSDSKKYSIADSFNKSLHDTTHTLVDEVICKTTVCKVDYEFEYDSEDAISFIDGLTSDFSNSGWRDVNHGSVITDGSGMAKVTLWLHNFDENMLDE